MKQLAMYWSAMVIMYVIASKLRNRKENFKWVNEAINVPIYVLVLLMGLRMGANKEIVDSLGTIGIQSVIVSVLVIGSSILGVIIMRTVLKMDRYGNEHRFRDRDDPEDAGPAVRNRSSVCRRRCQRHCYAAASPSSC